VGKYPLHITKPTVLMMQPLITINTSITHPFPSLENIPALTNLPVIRAGVERGAVNQVWGTLTEYGRDVAVLIAAQ